MLTLRRQFLKGKYLRDRDFHFIPNSNNKFNVKCIINACSQTSQAVNVVDKMMFVQNSKILQSLDLVWIPIILMVVNTFRKMGGPTHR